MSWEQIGGPVGLARLATPLWTEELNLRPLLGAARITDTLAVAFTRDYGNAYHVDYRSVGDGWVQDGSGRIPVIDADILYSYAIICDHAQQVGDNLYDVILMRSRYTGTPPNYYDDWTIEAHRFTTVLDGDGHLIAQWVSVTAITTVAAHLLNGQGLTWGGDGRIFLVQSASYLDASPNPLVTVLTWTAVGGWQVEGPDELPMSDTPGIVLWVGGDRLLTSTINNATYPPTYEVVTLRRTGPGVWVLDDSVPGVDVPPYVQIGAPGSPRAAGFGEGDYRLVPYTDDYQGVYYPSPGVLTSDPGFMFTAQDGSTSTWYVSTPAATTPRIYNFYLTHVYGTQLGLAMWEPYDPTWRSPKHKWSDVYMQGELNVWGSDGGVFFRMSDDRTSYWKIDKVGVHFVDHGHVDTVQTFTHPKVAGDWFQIDVVADTFQIETRDTTVSGGIDYLPPVLDGRNRSCTKHGAFDVNSPSVRTEFSYIDIMWDGNNGHPVSAKTYGVDPATGAITVGATVDIPTPNGQSGGRNIITMAGPDGVALALVSSDPASYYYGAFRDFPGVIADYVPNDLTAVWVTSTGAVHTQPLGTADNNLDPYATGVVNNHPFLLGDYLLPDAFLYALFLAWSTESGWLPIGGQPAPRQILVRSYGEVDAATTPPIELARPATLLQVKLWFGTLGGVWRDGHVSIFRVRQGSRVKAYGSVASQTGNRYGPTVKLDILDPQLDAGSFVVDCLTPGSAPLPQDLTMTLTVMDR